MFIAVLSCNAIDFACDFKFEAWAIIDRVYECKVHDFESLTVNQTISKASGIHAKGNNDNNVHALHMFGQKCYFLPDNIHKVFNNLEGILIAYAGLKKISTTDLQNFPELLILMLPNNDIEILEQDLFKFNTQLRAFVINHNKIKHIAHRVFQINSLTKIFIYKNVCIDSVAVNKDRIKDLEKEMMESCAPKKVQKPKVKTETELRFEKIEGKLTSLEGVMVKNFDVLFVQLGNIEKSIEVKNGKATANL